jgi:hypothetical protein
MKETVLDLDLVRFTGTIFFIFACIPWVSFGLNRWDSQPWALIVASLFLALSKFKLPPHSFALITLTLLGLTVTFIFTRHFETFTISRAVIGYATIPLLYIAFYNLISRYGFPLKTFVFINYVWLAWGLVELFFPEIGGLVSAGRTTENRGVTSLSPEPTFFGIYLFFASWVLLVSRNYSLGRHDVFLLTMNFCAVLLLAKSTMVLLFYFLAFSLFVVSLFLSYSFKARQVITIALVAFLSIVVMYLSLDWLEGSRLLEIFQKANINTLTGLIFLDASINQRLEAPFFSVYGALNNYMIPGGLDTFTASRDALSVHAGDFFWYPTDSNKIMSWHGSYIYELGLFGLIFIGVIFKAAFSMSRVSIINFCLLLLVLFSAIPVTFPLVPLLFVLLVIKKKAASELKMKLSRRIKNRLCVHSV